MRSEVRKREIYKAVPVDEPFMEITEICCSHFGCGRILTMQEKLYGKKCTRHQDIIDKNRWERH